MARKGNDVRGVPLAPLTGVLDLRSNPDLMQSGSLRLRQNLQTVGENKLIRGRGWQKLLSSAQYNNEDYHDQLLALSNGAIRQPVTLLSEAESTGGVRWLFAATQSRILRLNQYSGNWRILGDGYGGNPSTSAQAPRFQCGQQGDYLVFTNDFDAPMYHQLEYVSLEGEPNLQEFADAETIGLTKAALVWTWHNVVFFADVEVDSQRRANMILWGDYDNPTSLDPGKAASIAGNKVLDSNERILAGRALGNSFLIYTTRAIWEMVVVGGEKSFDFVKRYAGDKNENTALLKYPNTLVALPDAHIYMAEDGVYAFSPYYGKPERLEWLHRSTPYLYDNIDSVSCNVHVATYAQNELLISTASLGATDQCPDRTLRVNMQYRVPDIVDFGFTAFCQYRPQSVPTVRDFILANDICSAEELNADYPYDREGMPRPGATITAPFTPSSIWTSDPKTIGDVVTEDWEALAGEFSLCAILGDTGFDEWCHRCESKAILVGASSQDWCLKQLGEVLYRERCANPTAVGDLSGGYSSGGSGGSSGSGVLYYSAIGSYILDPYDSIICFAPMFVPGAGSPMVQMGSVRLNAVPVVEAEPRSIGLRAGISADPQDSNNALAPIVWYQHRLYELKAITKLTPAQHLAAKTIPTDFIEWPLYRLGRVLYVELKIAGTNGDVTLSGIQAEVRPVEANNY